MASALPKMSVGTRVEHHKAAISGDGGHRGLRIDRQTQHDWGHRYNVEDVVELSGRRWPGAALRLTPEQLAQVADLMRCWPDFSVNCLVRW